MFKGIIDFALEYIVFPVAILMITIGGAIFIFSGGNPGLVQRGKSIMRSVAIGILVIFSAWLIVNVFFSFIGLSDFGKLTLDLNKWFKLNCQIKLY